MPFESLTIQKIKGLADGSKIYQRGENYFHQCAVTKVWVEGNRLFAKVIGSYDDYYKVEIEDENGEFTCQCSCPYDGYNCKHIVAVCLEFLNNKEEILNKSEQTSKQEESLQDKLLKLEKEDLADLLILSLKTHRSWKTTFLGEVAEKLEQSGLGENNQQIYEEEFHDHFNCVCNILHEHNKYGGGDYEEEEEVYERLPKVEKLFTDGKLTPELKRKFTDKMFYYYDWGNSGFGDAILDSIYTIASSDDDWHYIIKKLRTNDSEWRESLIADIYLKELKDEAAYLSIKEQNLESSANYDDLVRFWTQKGEIEKAVEIAKKGLEKSDRASSVLLEYLFEYYKNKEYSLALEYLKEIYSQRPRLENYKRLKKFVKKEEWNQVDQWCQSLLSKKQSHSVLAEIHEFNKEYDKVLAYVLSGTINIWGNNDKEKFANKLIPKYPEQLLPFYENLVTRYIELMERKNYKIAAGYAKKVKEIYCHYLKKEEEWKKYVDSIRQKYVKRPALLDEFKKL